MEPLPIQPEPTQRVSYPPPPNVHWAVLFAVQIFVVIVAMIFTPRAFWNLAGNLAFDAWAIYICLWIRKLEPAAMSLFWCIAFVAIQVVFNVPVGPAPAGWGITIFAAVLVILAFALWVVTIYVVRAELHFHYNLREPVGLYLDGVMTFFFSFLYFQYHLYKIAQLRERYGDRPFYYQGGPPVVIPEP